MEDQKKPEIVKEIEALWGGEFELHKAPVQANKLDGLMAYKENLPKYALDEEGRIIGLNLSKTGLDDAKWSNVLSLLNAQNSAIIALELSDNALKGFSLGRGLNHIEKLDLEGNPLESPPEEILKQGTEAVLRFLKELEAQGTREVYEVKMLIVGEGGTGKTTLWNKLQDKNYPVPLPLDKQPMTIGIGIKEGWSFEHLDESKVNFLVNLWDFGGQEIQYMTHQFFLTRRSFYVLLADVRRDVANFSYWFKVIELLGADPEKEHRLPVLVVLNEKGNPIPKMPYEPATIEDEFPHLKVVPHTVDLAKNDYKFEGLLQAIKEILCRQMPHLPLRMPTFWDDVRKELLSLRGKANHISFRQFKEICVAKEIEGEAQMLDLSQLLHDLGIILHYHEDISLADFIILNPEWAVNAVYEVLRHESVSQQQGRFDMKMMQKLWNSCGFTIAEQGHLKHLMLKDNFEVCFRATEDGREIYIAPQMLPEQRPPLEWNTNKVFLRYAYQYPLHAQRYHWEVDCPFA